MTAEPGAEVPERSERDSGPKRAGEGTRGGSGGRPRSLRLTAVAGLCAAALAPATPAAGAAPSAAGTKQANPPSDLVESFPLGKRARPAGAPVPASRPLPRAAVSGNRTGTRPPLPLILACGVAALAALGLASQLGERRRRTRKSVLEAMKGGRIAIATPVATGVGTVSRSSGQGSNGRRAGSRQVDSGSIPALASGGPDDAGGDEAAAAFDLGVLLEQQDDLEGAERAYRRGDQAGSTDAAFNLGILLHRRGDVRRAEGAYRRASTRGDADAAFNLGVLLYEQGNLAGAEAEWRRCDRAGSAKGAANLGHLLEAQGDLAAAEYAYRRAEGRGDATAASRLEALSGRRRERRGHPARP